MVFNYKYPIPQKVGIIFNREMIFIMVYRNFREDMKTHKKYTLSNIPINKVCGVRITQDEQYRILSQSAGHGEDCWYNGEFIGDYYCVAKYNFKAHCWQQISKWYFRYGNAINFLSKLCDNDTFEREGEVFKYDTYEPI